MRTDRSDWREPRALERPPTTPTSPQRWAVPEDVMRGVLAPYRVHCRYVKSVSMEYTPVGPHVGPDDSEASITAEGPCAIPESCYIDSTGHFNAVEFQICANQIMYATFAECVRLTLLRAFASLDMPAYWERRLPNVLITNMTSNFKRIINPRRFYARHQIDRSYLIKERAFWESRLTYWDDEGGLADGTCVGSMALGALIPPKE